MPTPFWFRTAAFALTAMVALVLVRSWRADRRDRAQLIADLASAQQALSQADARQHDRDAQLQQTLKALASDKRSVITPAQILRELPRQIPLPIPITLQPVSSRNKSSSAASDRSGVSSRSTAGARPLSGPASDQLSAQPRPQPGSAFAQAVNWDFTIARKSNQPIFGAISARNPNQPRCEPLEGARSRRAVRPTASGSQVVMAVEDLKPLYDFGLDCRACQARLEAAQGDLADERTKTAVLTQERDAAVRIAKGGNALRRIARAAKWLAIGAVAGAIAARTAH